MSKIMGFGGDYAFIEGVYGHAVMAKENIARVLASKVDDRAFGLDEAEEVCHVALEGQSVEAFLSQRRS